MIHLSDNNAGATSAAGGAHGIATHTSSVDQGEQGKREQMLQSIPSLRKFAASLTGSTVSGDDLVQETVLRALASLSHFEAGTNMDAWLFTILRHLFYSQYRKERQRADYYRSVEDLNSGQIYPDQYSHLELGDLRRALAALPDEQREAIILVGASGLSYDEAAGICGCAAGTVKSRVSRARARLGHLMDPDRVNVAGSEVNSLQIA
jgi:RNA polymerase sigma-70 factor (ECF subfamily)